MDLQTEGLERNIWNLFGILPLGAQVAPAGAP